MLFFSHLLTARPTEQKIELLKKQGLSDEQIELCIAADPTEKDYVQWVAKQFKGKLIQLPEDTEKIKKQLTMFQKMTRSPKFKTEADLGGKNPKDINSYNPGTLYETVGDGESLLGAPAEGETQAAPEVPWETMANGKKEEWIKTNWEAVRSRILAGEKFPGAELIVNENAAQPLTEEEKAAGETTKTGLYQIVRASEARALMCLSQTANWCTKGENYANQYLKSGPDYVFFLNGAPYAQWDPNGGHFLDVKDQPFQTKTLVKGITYILDEQCKAFVAILAKWFKTNKQAVPEKLKAYLTSKDDAEKTLQKKRDRGSLSLEQLMQADKTSLRTGINNPEEQQKLAEQYLPNAKFADVLWFIKKLQTEKYNGYTGNTTPAQIRVQAAEPYLLSKMALTNITQALTYWKQWGMTSTWSGARNKPWPEFQDAALNLLQQGVSNPPPNTKDSWGDEIKGVEKVYTQLDNFLKNYEYRTANPWNQKIHDLLLSESVHKAVVYDAYKGKNDRDPGVEQALINSDDLYQMMEYWHGGNSRLVLDNVGRGNHIDVKIPAHIAPARWEPLEKLLISKLTDERWGQTAPGLIKQYEKVSGYPLSGEANLTEVEYQKLNEFKSKMEQELQSPKDLSYSSARTHYATVLGRLLAEAVKKDVDDPKIDQELRWFRAYLQKAMAAVKIYDEEKKKTDKYFHPSKIEINDGVKNLIRDYKEQSWDRKVSSLKRAMLKGNLRQAMRKAAARRVLSNLDAQLRNRKVQGKI